MTIGRPGKAEDPTKVAGAGATVGGAARLLD